MSQACAAASRFFIKVMRISGADGSWRPEQGFSTVFGWMGSVVEARSATRIAMEQMRDAWRAEVGGTFQEKEYAPRRTAGKNVFLGWHGPPGLGWIASRWGSYRPSARGKTRGFAAREGSGTQPGGGR